MFYSWKITAAAGLLSCGFFLFSGDVSGDFLAADPVRKIREEKQEKTETLQLREKKRNNKIEWAYFFSRLQKHDPRKVLPEKELKTLLKILKNEPESVFLVSFVAAEFRKSRSEKERVFLAEETNKIASAHPEAFFLASVAGDMFRELKQTKKALQIFRNSAEYIFEMDPPEEREKLLQGNRKEYALYLFRSIARIYAEEKEYLLCDRFLDAMLEKKIFPQDPVLSQFLLHIRYHLMENSSEKRQYPLFFWMDTPRQRAVKRFDEAVEIYEKTVTDHHRKGRELFLSNHRGALSILAGGKYSFLAENMILSELLSGKDHRLALLLLSDFYAQKGEELLSAGIWQKMLEEPHLPSAPSAFLILAAKFSRNEDFASAVKAQELAFAADPERKDTLFTLCKFYTLTGQWEKAHKLLAGLFPDKNAFSLAGIFYMQQNMHEKALKYFLRADFIAERVPPVKMSAEERKKRAMTFRGEPLGLFCRRQLQIALAAEKVKNHALVEKHLKKLLREDPGNAQAMNFLGYSLAERNKDLAFAQRLIEGALKKDPENYAYLDSLAWVKYKKKEFSAASKHILKAIELAGKSSPWVDPVLWDHAGDIFLALHDKEKAIRYWNRALEVYSGDICVKEIMEKIRKTKGRKGKNNGEREK